MAAYETIQTIANVATAMTFAAAAWQLWESNQQVKQSAIQKRSEYVIDLYNTFINDKEMISIYYDIEYNKFLYANTFHGSILEKQLDKLLGHFSNIGRLYLLGILTKDDLRFFEYEFLVIHGNKNVQAYLRFLDDWFKAQNINGKKFESFRSTCQSLKEGHPVMESNRDILRPKG